MDAKDRDDSKLRQREEMLARRVGEALDQMDPHAGVECPDAEVLAAYAEQSLESADSARWESHFAACTRCRKILRVLAASDATPLADKEVAQLGELVSAARIPAETKAGSPGPGRPRLLEWRARWPAAAGWLAPALGVAAVFVVWLAMRAPWRAADHGASTTLIAQAPREETPTKSVPADQLSKIAPQLDQKLKAAPPPDRISANTPSVNPLAGVPAESRAEAGNAFKKVSPGAGLTGSTLQKEEKSVNPSGGSEMRSSRAPATPPPAEANAALETPAPAPPPQARAKADTAAQPAPEALPSTSQTVTVTGAAPLVETTNGTLGGAIQQKPSADLSLNGRNYKGAATLLTARQYSALLKAPSGTTLWRAGKAGIIERSSNAGRSWISQKSSSQEDWLAGAAVSDTVCWLAGRNGAIARTADGEHWERVTPPAQAAGTDGAIPDWTGITAREARSATVTARDGRRFTTSDGGATWQAQ